MDSNTKHFVSTNRFYADSKILKYTNSHSSVKNPWMPEISTVIMSTGTFKHFTIILFPLLFLNMVRVTQCVYIYILCVERIVYMNIKFETDIIVQLLT